MAKQGKTTGNLKMRSGPGMQFEPPIAYLVPDTALEILGEEGDWWKVRAQGKEGYVGKKYVAVTEVAATVEPKGEGARAAGDVTKGSTPARPAVKPAAPKGIAVDASAIDASRKPKSGPAKPQSKPSAPKTNTVTTSVRPMPQPKGKGTSGGSKKS